MEANAVAPTLATAERVCPADAGSDRRDRPARAAVLHRREAPAHGGISLIYLENAKIEGGESYWQSPRLQASYR
jgi:hypothetical protein